MVRPLLPHIAHFVCITPDNPRRLPAAALASHLQTAGAKATACETVKEGVDKAIALAGKDGVVLSFGSLYAIGDIKNAI